VKDTHGATIRIAPPLVVSEEDLDWGLAQLRAVLEVDDGQVEEVRTGRR
jgi:ornithine--oxo-acid transaminase